MGKLNREALAHYLDTSWNKKVADVSKATFQIIGKDIEEMTVDVYKVRYKTVKSSRFDTTAFKKAMPDLAA